MNLETVSNSENSSTSGEIGAPGEILEPSVARSEAQTSDADAELGGDVPPPDGGGMTARRRRSCRSPATPLSGTKTSSAETAGEAIRSSTSSVGLVSSDAPSVNPLGRALAALDRRDYASAKRLFEALGRKDAAVAIENALAALDRKDYATAQGLFEALDAPQARAVGRGSDGVRPPGTKAETPAPVVPPLEVVRLADRRPAPMAQKAKARSLARPLFRTAVVLCCDLRRHPLVYLSPPNWTLAAMKSQAIAGLGSAVDLVKTPLDGDHWPKEAARRSAPRCATSARRSPK